MRAATFVILLLTACFDRDDAVGMVRAQNRPEPIICVVNSTGKSGENNSFTCTDGDDWVWLCDAQKCIITWRPQ